jgi:hypothetical protein
MTHDKRKLLRPEESASLEEFVARSSMEQLELRGSTGTWKNIGLSGLSGLLALVAIAFWYVFATSHDAGRWVGLVIALIVTVLLVWTFGSVMGPGVRGSRRYYQLNRLRKEWLARAQRGEIPESSPGGPRVWRYEDGTTGH